MVESKFKTTMKNITRLSISLLLLCCLLFTACVNEGPNVETPEENTELNLLAMSESAGETEMTNFNIRTGLQTFFDIECMVLSSAVLEPATQSLGYTDCSENFRLVNLATGEEIAAYPLPGPVNMAVIVPVESGVC